MRTEPTRAVPAMVGVGDVAKSVEVTVAVLVLVLGVGVYAALLPVTVTDIVAPRSAPMTAYVDADAPLIGVPFLFHL